MLFLPILLNFRWIGMEREFLPQKNPNKKDGSYLRLSREMPI
jgi:hypothetical protein